MPPALVIVIGLSILALVYVVAALVRHARTRRAALARLRDTWGQDRRTPRAERPVDRWWRRIGEGGQEAYEIDDETWADLEMDRVFAWADRTLTAIGAQVLRAWLRSPRADRAHVKRRRALASALSASPEHRVRLQAVLLALGDRRGWDASTILCDRPPALPLPLWAYGLLAGALVLALIAVALWPGPITFGALLAIAVVNPVVHALSSRGIDATITSLQDLAALVRAASRAHAVLSEEARAAVGDVTSDLAKARAVVAKGGATLLVLPSGAETFAETLLEYGRAFFLAEARAYLRTIDAIQREREALVRTLRFLGELDAGLSLAHLRTSERGLCEPGAAAGELSLEATAITHPLVRGAVPNDVRLGPRGLLVTGSNMAGKSTFLRTLGVNALLAQTLGFACAERFACGPLLVFASMGVEDDLEASVSLYQSEVLRIRMLLEHGSGSSPCLFLLDEVFRGTNPRDRVAASCAVLRSLARTNLVVAATHDLGLASLTEGAYELGHFSEHIDGDDVVFDYRLRPGLSRRTNALHLLARLGYPPEVVAHAESVAQQLTAS